MKIKITAARSIYGKNGQDLFGETLTLKGEPPAGWAGKYQVVDTPKKEGSEPVTNPADDKKDEKKDEKK